MPQGIGREELQRSEGTPLGVLERVNAEQALEEPDRAHR